jgi:hypothetical protein
MRELATLGGALAMTLSLMVWGATEAAAGGPTSVLVTSPTSGQATALYYSDEQYGKLEQLLGSEGKGTRDKPPEADLTRARQINVTWLAHDISPWQPTESPPAIATPDSDAETSTVRVTVGDKDDGTDWWWAIPGAAAGAGLALVLRPFAVRLPLNRWRKGREPGPRQELRDV